MSQNQRRTSTLYRVEERYKIIATYPYREALKKPLISHEKNFMKEIKIANKKSKLTVELERRRQTCIYVNGRNLLRPSRIPLKRQKL